MLKTPGHFSVLHSPNSSGLVVDGLTFTQEPGSSFLGVVIQVASDLEMTLPAQIRNIVVRDIRHVDNLFEFVSDTLPAQAEFSNMTVNVRTLGVHPREYHPPSHTYLVSFHGQDSSGIAPFVFQATTFIANEARGHVGDIPPNTASLCIVDSSFENLVLDSNSDSPLVLGAIGIKDPDVIFGVVNTCFTGLSSPNPVNPIVPITLFTDVDCGCDGKGSGKGSGKGGKGSVSGGSMSMMKMKMKYSGKMMK
jgi:hypothetical protein